MGISPDLANSKYVTGVTYYAVQGSDNILSIDTSVNPVTVYLPNILQSGLDLFPKTITILDASDNAGTNNITILGINGDEVNGGLPTVISVNGAGAKCSILGKNGWIVAQTTDDQPGIAHGTGTPPQIVVWDGTTHIRGYNGVNANASGIYLGSTPSTTLNPFNITQNASGYLISSIANQNPVYGAIYEVNSDNGSLVITTYGSTSGGFGLAQSGDSAIVSTNNNLILGAYNSGANILFSANQGLESWRMSYAGFTNTGADAQGFIHLAAGNSAIPAILLTSSFDPLATQKTGAFEFNANVLYFTPNGTRYAIAYTNGGQTFTSATWNATKIGTIYGGTGITSYNTGDIIYASATNTLSNLPAGTNGYVLQMVGGIPQWTASAGSVTSISVVSANGFSGTVANPTTTPSITLSTTTSGVLKGSSGSLVAATASDIISFQLTGYVSTTGTITPSDTILSAIEKLNGNIALLTGAVVYKGLWDASTNTPHLTSGVGTSGWLYIVSVAGSTNLDGITQWNVGDSTIFNGTAWDKLDGVANEVLSVFGRTGAVVATSTDYSGIAMTGVSSYNGLVVTPNTGVITTGSWNGTTIGTQYGGTGLTSFTQYGLVYAPTTSSLGQLGLGTAGQVLVSNGTGSAPSFQTLTTGGTVTSVSVVTNQGVSGSVSNPTTTPAITLSLGAITNVISYNGLVVTPNTGVITTGTWNGSVIGQTYGGTGVNNAGTLTYGSNNITFTTSGTTSLTLPTSGTLTTGTGSANSVAYWSSANNLTYNSNFTYNGSTLRVYGSGQLMLVSANYNNVAYLGFNNINSGNNSSAGIQFLSDTGYISWFYLTSSGYTSSGINTANTLVLSAYNTLNLGSLNSGVGFYINNQRIAYIDNSKNHYLSNYYATPINLDKAATNGFVYLPTSAGTPTGTPASLPTGQTPITFDSTNGNLNAYFGGSWHTLSFTSSSVTSVNTTTGAVTLTVANIGTTLGYDATIKTQLNIPTGTSTITGLISATDWSNFEMAYTNMITSLTTTGNSGSATLISNVLNIPTYTLSGLGGQPLNSNLTSLSGLSYSSASFVKMTGANTFTLDTNTYVISGGSGATNNIAYWSSATTLASSNNFQYNPSTNKFAVGSSLTGSFLNFDGTTGGNGIAQYAYFLNTGTTNAIIGSFKTGSSAELQLGTFGTSYGSSLGIIGTGDSFVQATGNLALLSTNGSIKFSPGASSTNTEVFRIDTVGFNNVGSSSNAFIQLKAQTALYAPILLTNTSAIALSSQITGALEFYGNNLYFTPNGTRYAVAYTNGGQTFTSATWNGSTITVGYGGTGITSYSQGDLLIGNGSGTLSQLGIGANAYVLTSNGTTASWQPASGGLSPTLPTNSIFIGNSSNVATPVAMSGDASITYSPGYGSLTVSKIGGNPISVGAGGLTIGAGGFTTVNSNTITLTAVGLTNLTLPTFGIVISTANTWTYNWGLTGNVGTTAGTNFIGTTDAVDIVFKTNNSEVGRFKSGGGLANVPSYNGLVITQNTGVITTGTWNGSTVGATYGGTGINTYTTGDMIYSSSTNTLSKLGVGLTGQILTISGGVPTWQNPSFVPYTGATNNVNLGTFNLTTSNLYGGSTTTSVLTLNSTSNASQASGSAVAFAIGTGTAGGVTWGSTGPSLGNVYLGYQTPVLTLSNYYNVGLGFQSLNSINASGSKNVGLGALTGASLTSGTDNIFIGNQAGQSTITTGSYNILIGSGTAVSGSGQLTSIALGRGTTVTGSNLAQFGNSTYGYNFGFNNAASYAVLELNPSPNILYRIDQPKAFWIKNQTYTDGTTSAGTVTNGIIARIGTPTMATSTNAITVTNAISLYVDIPNNGANVTFTNTYSIWATGTIATPTLNLTNGTYQTNLIQSGSQTSNYTLTLPSALPASNGYVLSSTTAGVMSWISPPSSGWSLTGNSGTTAGTNFIGTTDATDLVFKTNSVEYGRFISGGGFKITGAGSSSSTNTLQVLNSSSTNLMTIRDDGHIGINTTPQNPLLTIVGTDNTNGNYTFWAKSANGNTTLFCKNDNTVWIGSISGGIGGTLNVTASTPSIAVNTTGSSTNGQIVFGGNGFNTYVGQASSGYSNIYGFSNSSYIANLSSIDIALKTQGGKIRLGYADTRTDVLTINTSNSFAGINQTSPSTALHVTGTGSNASTSTYTFRTESSNNVASLIIRDDGAIGMGTSPLTNCRTYIQGFGSNNTTVALRVDNSSSQANFRVYDDGTVYASYGSLTVGNSSLASNSVVSMTTASSQVSRFSPTAGTTNGEFGSVGNTYGNLGNLAQGSVYIDNTGGGITMVSSRGGTIQFGSLTGTVNIMQIVTGTSKITMNGQLNYNYGTPSAGLVMTSDASGNASWGVLPTAGASVGSKVYAAINFK